MKERRRLVGGLQLGLEFLATTIERLHLRLGLVNGDLVVEHQVEQLLDTPADSLDLPLRRRQPGTPLHPKPIHLLGELAAELLEEVVAQQLLLKRSQDALFDLPPPNREQVRAGAAATCTEAAEVLARIRDETRAAFTALRQPGKQVLRPTELVEALAILRRLPLVPHIGVPRLDAVPQFVIDDAELGDILRDPLGRWIHACDSLAGIGILQEALPIPDKAPDVQLVVEDAIASLRVAMNRAGAPPAALWALHSFGVQRLRDLLGRGAGQIVLEDAPNDRGLPGDDSPLTSRNHAVLETPDDPVAEADTATRSARFHPTTQAASRLLRQLLQEQRVHRPLEADVQVRDVTFCERDDIDAGERQAFEQAGGVFLIAAEAIERLGHHDVELLLEGLAHHRLEARAHDRRTRDGMVRVLGCDLPALALRELAADAELVGDRRVALVL